MHCLNTLWSKLYAQWQPPPTDLIPGYTIMILVPGDLPFFLKIALETCSRQNSEHLIETLVVPDNRLQAGFIERFEQYQQNYAASPVRLVAQHPVEKLFTRYYQHAHNNYWLQVVRGINAVRTTHVLFHDVDLYIPDPEFLRLHFEACLAAQQVIRGVSKAWDPWFMEQEIDHIVATWEAMFDINWFRSFQPWQHRGQDFIVAGQRHACDATYWPQSQTSPAQIGCAPEDVEFLHFYYVTGNYRKFQAAKGPFEDVAFRLLLVRLLIDAYDPIGWQYDIPAIAEFVRGTHDSMARVTYLQPQTAERYPEFRAKLQTLLDSGVLEPPQMLAIQNGIQPFDKIFGDSPIGRPKPHSLLN